MLLFVRLGSVESVRRSLIQAVVNELVQIRQITGSVGPAIIVLLVEHDVTDGQEQGYGDDKGH